MAMLCRVEWLCFESIQCRFASKELPTPQPCSSFIAIDRLHLGFILDGCLNHSSVGLKFSGNSPEPVIVTDLPKLDIDLYVQNYVGRTRYDRLILIGKCCVPLRLEALKAAIAEAKNGSDVARYKEAWEALRSVAPNEPEAKRDGDWIEETETANRMETLRLESELKGYKNNLIKESIRMGNEDLGKHLESIGKLTEAAEAYTRMRPDVSTTKHIVDCGMHLANVALQRRDWTSVRNHVGKVASIQTGDDEKSLLAYTRIVSGIALLGLENYPDSAKTLIQTDPNVPYSEYNHIASPNDVAIYGGLLALATMDRKDLQARILDNSSFRTFLEQEPHIRKAIGLFVNGRYSNCLEILESVRADYMIDIYLQPHIPEIYSRIRAKCIIQYFIPFSCVTLESLDTAFSLSGQSIEGELVRMISDGSLKARIDTKNRLLVAVRPDPRLAMQSNALNIARRYEQEAKERLRRMNIIAAGLEVAGAKKNAASTAGGSTLEEAWFEGSDRNLAATEVSEGQA
ncbi:COP9 signalosome complex subunit 1 [Cladobotryum mycophilum]|uniref:COP9 signalosome complex subunit 1 n=1 Tax=Cladobotryum mycophilum TaxID=491253 RepID=A0ABR0SZ51_9HYPO